MTAWLSIINFFCVGLLIVAADMPKPVRHFGVLKFVAVATAMLLLGVTTYNPLAN
jgi:hypothetical protein